ncbi:hypothetical protein D1007_41451 [Hordeum vulgare]|nr:hypothetical protein D1007_41451 [Hordeum vulgare]
MVSKFDQRVEIFHEFKSGAFKTSVNTTSRRCSCSFKGNHGDFSKGNENDGGGSGFTNRGSSDGHGNYRDGGGGYPNQGNNGDYNNSVYHDDSGRKYNNNHGGDGDYYNNYGPPRPYYNNNQGLHFSGFEEYENKCHIYKKTNHITKYYKWHYAEDNS